MSNMFKYVSNTYINILWATSVFVLVCVCKKCLCAWVCVFIYVCMYVYLNNFFTVKIFLLEKIFLFKMLIENFHYVFMYEWVYFFVSICVYRYVYVFFYVYIGVISVYVCACVWKLFMCISVCLLVNVCIC